MTWRNLHTKSAGKELWSLRNYSTEPPGTRAYWLRPKPLIRQLTALLLHSSLLQAEHAQDEFMFQLQHSLGSTEGLPSLVTTARLSPFLPFLCSSSVSGQSSSSLSKFCFLLCLQITQLPWGSSSAPTRCLPPSPSVAAEEPGTAALLFSSHFKGFT